MNAPQATPKRWPWVLAGVLLLSLLGRACDTTHPDVAAQRAGSQTATQSRPPSGLSADSKQKLAALINLNGELCAQVQNAIPLSGDRYNVTCTRYRDGTGTVTYELDVTTGKVK